jgi:predicted transcriptional regulator
VKDDILKEEESYRLIEEIKTNTGMTNEEIKKNVNEKIEILKWFVRQQIRDLNQIGRVVAIYYSDPDRIMKGIQKHESVEKIIKSWFE